MQKEQIILGLNEIKPYEKNARKTSWLAFVSVLCYIGIARISLIFIPNDFDFANESMNTLFGTSIRISIVSAILLLLANLLDVVIYNIIKKKSKFVWLRNNVSTMVSNCIENFLFVFLAFFGIMPIEDLLLIALGTTIIEIITSICDTPFLYLAIKIKDKKQSTLI